MVDFKKLLRKRYEAVLNKHFKLPFRLDEGCFYIVDSRENTVFECVADLNNSNYGNYKNLLLRVVAKLNGESDEYMLSGCEDPYLYLEGERFLEIRGWGWLTSPHCENLSDKAAMEYQQKVLETCVKILGTF